MHSSANRISAFDGRPLDTRKDVQRVTSIDRRCIAEVHLRLSRLSLRTGRPADEKNVR